MDNRKNVFVIIKNDKITYEIYLTKLVKFIKNFNEVIIQSQIGLQEMSNSLINDILGIGGWSKEYEKKKDIICKNKEKKKYKLTIYEFFIKRDVHNQKDV